MATSETTIAQPVKRRSELSERRLAALMSKNKGKKKSG